MRKKYGSRITYLFLSALLAGTVSGCGTPASSQTQGENPAVGAVEGGISVNNKGSGIGLEDNGGGSAENPAEGNNSRNGAVNNAVTTGNAGAVNIAGTAEDKNAVSAGAEAVTDFGLRLLRGCVEAKAAFPPQASMPYDVYAETGMGDNILVSPLSVISALAMTANGARGETCAQMESAFGMPVAELGAYLADYTKALPETDKYKLSMANGIWFTEDQRFTVEQAFLDTNEALFGAGVYRAPFDESTLKEINGWVKENTYGMIEEILDEILPDAVMYLVNALAFDAEWQEIYHDYQVREGEFTKEDGTVQKADMMYSTENTYLEDEHAEGFLKNYADGKYAFAALLPEEGMTAAEYLSSLDGAKLRKILENPIRAEVDAAIPKYESEYSIEMNRVLQSLGITDAFEQSRADFSGIGYSSNGNLYISRVLHKTFIAVDEKGTKAGAATAVEIRDECAAIVEPVLKTVHLDRPFLYMIVDYETKVPVFIGIVETVG